MNVVKWCGFAFCVKKSRILPVKDISITMSVETENKTASGENYTSKKNLNPSEITMTGVFSAALGVKNVRTSALNLANLCRSGESDYVYIGKTKLMPPKFMGVNSKINNIEISPNGAWSYCEVQITLKQCEKYDGGTAGSSSSHKKKKKKSKGGGGNQPKEKIKGMLGEYVKQLNATKSQGKPDPTNYGRGASRVTKPAASNRRISGMTK